MRHVCHTDPSAERQVGSPVNRGRYESVYMRALSGVDDMVVGEGFGDRVQGPTQPDSAESLKICDFFDRKIDGV